MKNLKDYYNQMVRKKPLLLEYQFLIKFKPKNGFDKQFKNLNEYNGLICQSGTIPKRTLTTSTVSFYAKNFSMPATEQFDHTWKTTILLTQKMSVYSELRKMLLLYSSLENNSGGIRTIPNFNIELDILDQYSEINKNTPTIMLYGAFPTNIGPIQLQYEESSNTKTFDVTFAYQYCAFGHDADVVDPLEKSPEIII